MTFQPRSQVANSTRFSTAAEVRSRWHTYVALSQALDGGKAEVPAKVLREGHTAPSTFWAV